jgi:hypothetical protein
MSAPKNVPSNKTQKATEDPQRRQAAPKNRRRQVTLMVSYVYAEQADPKAVSAIVDELLRLLDGRPGS